MIYRYEPVEKVGVLPYLTDTELSHLQGKLRSICSKIESEREQNFIAEIPERDFKDCHTVANEFLNMINYGIPYITTVCEESGGGMGLNYWHVDGYMDQFLYTDFFYARLGESAFTEVVCEDVDSAYLHGEFFNTKTLESYTIYRLGGYTVHRGIKIDEGPRIIFRLFNLTDEGRKLKCR